MEPQEIKFDNILQEWAITKPDEEIYPCLSFCKLAKHCVIDDRMSHYEVCTGIRVSPVSLYGNYERRPEQLPFTRSGVQEFIDQGIPLLRGPWSVLWAVNRCKNDVVYGDGFRGVFIYKTIEFMIRPLVERTGPKRLHIGSGDVMNCLKAALTNNPDEQMRTVIGTGQAKHPDSCNTHAKPPVEFQWRIDRADEGKIRREVRKWRYGQFKGSGAYQVKKDAYEYRRKWEVLNQRRESAQHPARTQPEPMLPPYPPSSHPEEGTSSRRKRRSSSSDEPWGPGPSYKRRSTGSQSATSSPEMWSSTVGYGQTPTLGSQYLSQGSSWNMPPPPVPRSGSTVPVTLGISQGMSNLAITSPGLAYGQPGQGQTPPPPPPRAYGDGERPPRTLYRDMRDDFAPQPTYLSGALAPTTRPPPGTPQAGGYYPSQVLPPLAPGMYGPPGSMPPPDIPPDQYGMPQYQGMAPGSQGGGYPQYPYDSSPQSSQGGWTGEGGNAPPGPYYPPGGYPPSSHGHHEHGGRSRRD